MDLGKLHENFSGNFVGCLGATCPRSCCRQKNLFGAPPVEDEPTYRVALANQGELARVRSKMLEIPDNSIVIREITNEGQTTAILMDGCSQDKTCILETARPMLCKVYPFNVFNNKLDFSIASDCPGRKEIGENIRNQEAIRSLFLKLGKSRGFVREWFDRLREEIK